MNVVYTFNQSDHIKNMRVDIDDIVYCKHNLEEKTREIADIGMYHTIYQLSLSSTKT